jgi:ankyrin repeat protein
MSKIRILLFPVLLTFIFLLPSVQTSYAASIDDLVNAVWGFELKKTAELIDGGVDVNGKDAKGTFPLLLACSYKDNDEMIELLLSKGADPNVRGPNGESPLGLAAKYSLKTVQMLVDKGADVNAEDNAGFTALRWAKEMEQSEVIKFLKEQGAKE